MYTLASSAASHQRCHGLSVCMCVVGGGASLRKRKGHRDREREHVDKLGYVPLSQDNFTIYLSTETLKAPRSSDLEKTLRENPPPPSRWNCSFQITKANVANRTEDDSEQKSAVLVAAILEPPLFMVALWCSPQLMNMLSVAVAKRLCALREATVQRQDTKLSNI